MQRTKILTNERGIAVVIVVSILAIMVSMAVAFLLASRLETLKAFNFKEGMKARAIADAALEHAKALLREDKRANAYDDYTEAWHTAFAGSDVDTDDDGSGDAQWIDLLDENGVRYGRYAVSVVDEASKVNINTAGFHNTNPLKVTEGWSPFEVSLDSLFTALATSTPAELRDAIIAYRYGNNYPGVDDRLVDDNTNDMILSSDGIDNDADGDIDESAEGVNEPLEFNSEYPYGDDEPFMTIFDIKKIPAAQSAFKKIRNYITAFSADKNVTAQGIPRVDINYVDAGDLAGLLSAQGAAAPEQLAANAIDYRDTNCVQSVVISPEGTFYGVEGVRINEIMVAPIYTIKAEEHTNSTGPGGNWQETGNHFENAVPEVSGIGGVWWFESLRPGTYYVRLYGTAPGQLVGDVRINGTSHLGMRHGQLFKIPVTVDDDGRLKISISNGEIDTPGTVTYFSQFQLSEQPDCEYIEIVNITNEPIDISNWCVDGLRQNDLIGTIPAGTTINPFQYLVLAVDAGDGAPAPDALQGTGISFKKTWQGSPVAPENVVQLIFSDAVSIEDDVISNTPAVNNIVIQLKTDQGAIVDRVKYADSSIIGNQSFERDDPANTASSDTSHIYDQWNYSDGYDAFLPKGTPTRKNNNMNILGHIIGGFDTEVLAKNHPFATTGELGNVPSGGAWERVSLDTMRKVLDTLSVESLRLEAEGHIVTGSEGRWTEVSRSFPLTVWYCSSTTDDAGVWKFDREDRIQNGIYTLTVYGNSDEALALSIRRSDGSWTEQSPALTPDANNAIRYGVVDIGGNSVDATPAGTLELKVTNMSALEKASFDYIVLSPLPEIKGRVNINTASVPVLQALPGVSSETAARIFNAPVKPYGSIGDILEGTLLGGTEYERRSVIRQISNMITVRSDIYEIIVVAQALRAEKKTAEKKLRIVVER